MLTPVDRAFAIEQNKLQSKRDKLRERARLELPTLEIELIDIKKDAVAMWKQLCEAEGLTPEQIQRGERLFTSDENLTLAERYDAVSKLFTAKLKRYKVYCELLGIVPNLQKRGSPDEHRSTSNFGKSAGSTESPRLRQTRRDRRRRVPGRGGSGHNRGR